MYKSKIKKFYFTQISGILVAFVVCLTTSKFIAKYYSLNKVFNKANMSDWGLLFLIVIGFPFLLVSSMYLWGNFLVFLGILSKEEGRGYPYSKPWKNDE